MFTTIESGSVHNDVHQYVQDYRRRLCLSYSAADQFNRL